MQVINFSEARNNLKQVIDRVVADADVAVIARRDAPDAVVMSLDTFNSWMETVHLLKTPANVSHLCLLYTSDAADEGLVLAGPGPKDAEAHQRADTRRDAQSFRWNRKTRTTPRDSVRVLVAANRRREPPRLHG